MNGVLPLRALAAKLKRLALEVGRISTAFSLIYGIIFSMSISAESLKPNKPEAATLAPAPLAPSTLEIIPLKHRPAESIIPKLHQLSPNTHVTAAGNRLILRGSSSTDNTETAQLVALIQELDQPLAQFKIQVRQRRDKHDSSHQQSSGIHMVSDNQYTHSSQHWSSGTHSAQTEVHVKRYTTGNNSSLLQTITTLEGSPAFIETGESSLYGSSTPYVDGIYLNGKNGKALNSTFEPSRAFGISSRTDIKQQHKHSGFYITASEPQDNKVLIEIATQLQQPQTQLPQAQIAQAYASEPSPIDTIQQHHIESRFYAPLNQWFEIGSSSSNDITQPLGGHRVRSYATDSNQDGSNNVRVEIKIEKL